MKIRLAAALAVFCPTLALGSAATGVVGVLGSSNTLVLSSVELIDLVHGATAAGNYTSATVYWGGGNAGSSCASAFKLRFYHPTSPGSTDLELVAERGPFDASPGLVTVALTPAVTLSTGDLISVVSILGFSCGGPVLGSSGEAGATLLVNLDTTGTSRSVCAGNPFPYTLAANATMGGTEVRSGIVTGAGSAHGAAGSNFKTEIQAINPGAVAINVKLRFHPIGVTGSASDPSVSFSLGAFQSTRIHDIGDALGISGLGSIDVLSDESYPPLLVTHVFNDAGAAGTAGFSEPTVRSGDVYVLETLDTAFLFAPGDLTQYRMNVGVRTLSEGASLAVQVLDAATGAVKATRSIDYPADFFDQKTISDFLGGFAVSANDSIQIQVTDGRAIVYAVSVDNVTNDTSLQLGTRTHF